MYCFAFRPYSRKFCQPLRTHHGSWEVREGILLRLSDEMGNVGFGEIAPLPEFGSETFQQALHLCRQFPEYIEKTDILEISEPLPASQFGFESAWLDLTEKMPFETELPHSQLLPTGEAVFSVLESQKPEAGKTFKWKIGVTDIELELQWFDRLLSSLPPNATLRLDANGGLTWETANRWLAACEGRSIEFLEQPLPVTEFDEMLQLCDRYTTTIALDESVATLRQLETCIRRGWRGVFVVKAAIAGSPTRLRQLCENHRLDTVFSSVFETRIGREAALRLAARLQTVPRAVGFGIEGWFADDEERLLRQF